VGGALGLELVKPFFVATQIVVVTTYYDP